MSPPLLPGRVSCRSSMHCLQQGHPRSSRSFRWMVPQKSKLSEDKGDVRPWDDLVRVGDAVGIFSCGIRVRSTIVSSSTLPFGSSIFCCWMGATPRCMSKTLAGTTKLADRTVDAVVFVEAIMGVSGSGEFSRDDHSNFLILGMGVFQQRILWRHEYDCCSTD